MFLSAKKCIVGQNPHGETSSISIRFLKGEAAAEAKSPPGDLEI